MNVLIKEGLYVVQNNFDQRVLCAKCTFQMFYTYVVRVTQIKNKENTMVRFSN